MKRIPSWLTYTVLRLLVFIAPLVVLLLIGLVWWVAVVAAAIVGLCLSFIFLSTPRNALSADLYATRHSDRPTPSPDDDEDTALNESESGTAAPTPSGQSSTSDQNA